MLEVAARVVILSGGNLSEYSANDVTLGSKSKVINIGPNKLTLNFTGSSGSREHAPRPARLGKVTFNGVVLQKANQDSGYFLGTNQSGRVERHRLKP